VHGGGSPGCLHDSGAEGLRYEDGADIVIEDDPAGFADACVRLLTEDAARRTIANSGLARMQAMNSWKPPAASLKQSLKATGCACLSNAKGHPFGSIISVSRSAYLALLPGSNRASAGAECSAKKWRLEYSWLRWGPQDFEGH